jgi:hypothetical protein
MLPNGGGIDQSALNTLAQVKLQQLSATPTQIGPFGESTVRWSVSGTATGVTVTLNGVAVDAAGSQLVQPLVTTPYTLAARAGPYARTLGTIAVQVDLDACQIIPQPAGVLHTILSNFVRNVVLQHDTSLYFREYQATVNGVTTLETYVPQITFLPGLMQIVLNLGKSVNDFPDPSIDVTIVMGLGIVDGVLQASGSVVTGTVSEPWWAYALPGAVIWLGMMVSDAQDALPMDFAPLIAGIPEFLAGVLYLVGPGMEYQNVTIQADPTDQPIQLTACPAPASGTVSTVRSVTSINSTQLQQL